MPRRSVSLLLLLLGLGSVGVREAAAQELRGIVVSPDSATPARGILLTATDARGEIVGRALSDVRGEFQLRVPQPMRVTIRALQVGYRPTVFGAVDVGAAPTTVRVVLRREAVQLATITVRRSDACRSRDDSRTRVAEVWEEARKALLSAETQRDGDGLIAEWTQYDRQIDTTGRRVVDQEVHLARAPSNRPFRSQDAVLLAKYGYVVERDGEVIYYAPDADVLLSDSFAATHCFRLEAPPDERSSLIGLQFRPVDGARTRRDIEGTFWIDRRTAELRSLEFAFTNMPAVAERAEPGGRVEFTRLPDGEWLVSRWHIRMPELQRVAPSSSANGRVSVVGSPIRWRGTKVVGGEITQVERFGAVIFRARGSGLVVRLRPPPDDPTLPLLGTIVRLDGTDYAAVADSSGAARFPLVLAGQYRLSAITDRMTSARVQPAQQEVEIAGDSVSSISLRLPSSASRGPVIAGTSPSLVGTVPVMPPPRITRIRTEVEFIVTDTTDRPLAGVELVATDAMRTVHRLRSDSLGRALLVDLPAGEMRVEARFPGYYLAVGTVTVSEGRTPAAVLLEQSAGVVLDAVRVEADAEKRERHNEFERRRREGLATVSISRVDIERRGVVSTWQLLSTVSAVELIVGPDGVVPVSRRVNSLDLIAGRNCFMRLAIDGVVLHDVPVNLGLHLPPPSEIHGIEVFAGPASIPAEYAGDFRSMACGLIAVWTR
ncbi:MAG: carboxypeptidase regulatory-like domain-containing protein [Gemmatimonadaceae bacterium]